MKPYLFTSESVSQGHPDKIADQISDAILDAFLSIDPLAKVACETLITDGLVVIAGEISSKAHVDIREIVIKTIKEIGYDDQALGFNCHTCGILLSLNKQSADIAQGVEEIEGKEQGAGDQGLMFGLACDETANLIPLPLFLAHSLIEKLTFLRHSKKLPYLGPDAKSQVTVEYDKHHIPMRVDTIVLSTQHSAYIAEKILHQDITQLIYQVIPSSMLDKQTKIFINPTGRFVIGGPKGDTGLTGRKIMVDTYGGMGRHGGGAFSGKDPSKVDRSGAYMARYIAKNIVAAGLAKRCEVQLAYAIGIAQPVSISIDTLGTGKVSEEILSTAIAQLFDLTPKGIIRSLDLLRPIYLKTASGGHFGRNEEDFLWERIDKVPEILQTVKELVKK